MSVKLSFAYSLKEVGETCIWWCSGTTSVKTSSCDKSNPDSVCAILYLLSNKKSTEMEIRICYVSQCGFLLLYITPRSRRAEVLY